MDHKPEKLYYWIYKDTQFDVWGFVLYDENDNFVNDYPDYDSESTAREKALEYIEEATGFSTKYATYTVQPDMFVYDNWTVSWYDKNGKLFETNYDFKSHASAYHYAQQNWCKEHGEIIDVSINPVLEEAAEDYELTAAYIAFMAEHSTDRFNENWVSGIRKFIPSYEMA